MNATVLSLLLATVLAPPAKTSAERSTRIYVRTTPPGASIVLDGKELGTSDGLFLVPPGVRTITLEMDGYDPETKDFDIKEGWITRVEVRMVRRGEKPGMPASGSAQTEILHFVRWVIQDEDTMTFEGQPVNLNQLPSLLEKVPNRAETVLEVGYSSEISVKTRNEMVGRASTLARRFGFKYASDIGAQKLGSKGSPVREVGAREARTPDYAYYRAQRSQLEQRLLELNSELDDKLPHLGERHPDIVALRHGIEFLEETLRSSAQAVAASVRKIHLPDADTKDARVVLDLASGEMLELPREHNDVTYFTKLGKGDIGFDSMLFCLRGGEVERYEDGSAGVLDVKGMKDDAKIYQLPKLPCQLLVTTPEKRQFVVDVLKETAEGGLDLEYHELRREPAVASSETRVKYAPTAIPNGRRGFSDVIRMTLYKDTLPTNNLLDFDTGKVFPKPSRDDVNMDLEQWREEKGIDVSFPTGADPAGLHLHDMVVVPIGNDTWEKVSAATVEEKLRDAKPSAVTVMSRFDGTPQTVCFATRDGTKGILRLLAWMTGGASENCSIEYQLISPNWKQGEAKAQASAIENASELYRLDTGAYPKQIEWLLNQPSGMEDPDKWAGPYLKAPDGGVLADPWGNEYRFFWDGEESDHYLGVGSAGPDGEFETPDDVLTFDRAELPQSREIASGGILEFRVAANAEEAKAFEETGEGLGWYQSVMPEANQLVTRQQGQQTQILLWQTPDKSMTADGHGGKKWRVVEVSVVAEPGKPGRIGVVFDTEGGRLLHELTAGNVNRQMAMLVDGKVVSCPTIRSAIGPRVEITGDFSKGELNRLATALQAGMQVRSAPPSSAR